LLKNPETRAAFLAASGVFLAALLVRLIYLFLLRESPYYDVNLLAGTDCYAYYERAKRIAEGDLIGEGRFYQAPLYSYFLAMILKLSGDSYLMAVRAAQFILGSLTAAMACLMARKLAGGAAGILAGLLVAFYGPLIFYEGTFLRTSLLAFLNTALVFLLLARVERGALLLAAAIGLVFGLGLLAKPNLAVMTPILLWWIWAAPYKPSAEAGGQAGAGWPGPWKTRALLLASMSVGFVLVMSPLILRNHYAGAPRFSISQRGAFEFIAGNLPESPPAGWAPTLRAIELKDRAGRRLFPALLAVLELYRGHPLALIQKQLDKSLAFVYGYEVPNNVNYYVEKKKVRLFRLPLVTWPSAFALALVGLWFSRREWRRAFPLLAFLALSSAGVIAFYILARFRLPMVPALCVFSGIGLAGVIELMKQKRRLAAAVSIALAIGIALAVWPREADPLRLLDYYNLAQIYAQKGDRREAWLWVERGRASLEAAAESGEDGYTHYYRAYFMFLAGEPLARVEEELARARFLALDEGLELMVKMLDDECQRWRQYGDPRRLGLRFMGP